LDLDANPIAPGGAVALAQSPHLKGLERLTVSARAVGQVGAEALQRRFGEAVVLSQG
jgi:hypothetical protein